MKLYLAPVQGHTDLAYRYYFNKEFKGIDKYYTPFIRWEKEGLRPKDIRDLQSDMNEDLETVPQIIFRNADELRNLIEAVSGYGYREIDLNMGCPFPLQTGHGRGAALIADLPLLEEVSAVLNGYEGLTFTAKMRLGLNSPEEWEDSIEVINTMPLAHITMHPRVARQQYRGEVDMEMFGKFLERSANPVVYNGDIMEADDLRRIAEAYPSLEGIMIGRGLLGNPCLTEEYLSGENYSTEDRICRIMDFHDNLMDYYESVLCGDSQLLAKIKPFWEYSGNIIGRKAYKAIAKASNMAKYRSALALVHS